MTLSEILRSGQETLLGKRVAAVSDPEVNVRTTIVTFEEMLAGRIIQLNPKDPKKPRLEPLFNRYSLLQETYRELQRYYPPLPFDVNAQTVYNAIPPNVKNQTRALDCRIASIAVSLGKGHIVITQNQKDFRRIEEVIGVEWDDWTITPI